jgi:large subunit ribosomal protein L13
MIRKIHTIDATGQAYGRLASRIAILLRGKNKATYTPHLDEGDIVHVVNTDKMTYTGKKLVQKRYYRVSQYPGGLKTVSLGVMKEKDSGDALTKAVKQMLPANKLRPGMMKRLIIK